MQCLLCLVLATEVTAQESSTQPSPVSVKLQMIVIDRDRHSVDEFKKDELIVDGSKEAIVAVEKDERPTDFGLVIDSSGSLRTSFPMVLEVARSVIIGKRTTDQVFIERFISSDKIRIVQNFTSDASLLAGALNRFVVEGGQSAIIDGVYTAIDHLARHSPGDSSRRKALVLITDGEDRSSSYKADDLRRLLRQSRIQVFIIGLLTELDDSSGFIRKSSRRNAEALLKQIAQESGGRLFLPKSVKETMTAVLQITHDLQKQFIVTLQPGEPLNQGFREVKLKLVPNERKLNVITPPGYFIATSTLQQKN